MQYKNLGNPDWWLSGVLWVHEFRRPNEGTTFVDLSRPIIRHVVESGINFFDTASMSGTGTSEDVLGRAIKAMRRCVRHLQSPQLRTPPQPLPSLPERQQLSAPIPTSVLSPRHACRSETLDRHINSKSEVRSSSKWPAVIYRVQNAAPQTLAERRPALSISWSEENP